MKRILIAAILTFVAVALTSGQIDSQTKPLPKGERPCFTADDRDRAERTAKVYHDLGNYDPALGYDPAAGPRKGAPPADENGRGLPFACVATNKPREITGTLPKFYCTQPDSGGKEIRYKVKPQFKGQSRDKRNGEIYG